ncbi:L-histidine N(alpha)-methyltransferase [Massilia sp. TS11]|uniref:L-histidine N(alpha)-methyltransferase n=1 Tax=Massilia sp. TS11 TaxID=2908003 RepID=UPI001EDC0693|nr:L-histidine N(alpha)-methyltransferase [Massilia sp. TS11]MCG2584273.1 L-histidine N(alpha)-methyltransferase [Massilia sp. TS11]
MPLPHSAQRELAAGLLAAAPAISPKYLYDALGSRLFEAICELPEYYLTRTEAAIVARHGPALAAAIDPGCTLIDLGAGNCAKAASLFPLLHPAQYVPVDIAADFLAEAVNGLRRRYPHIEMTPLAQDFSATLTLPPTVRAARRVVFYPGSSIGNFDPEAALTLLRQARAALGDDGSLLLGVDLVKPAPLLQAAYDDALGITAAFNLNVLRHVNTLLGSDFDPRQWRHVAAFDGASGRVEMHLEARAPLDVHWPGGARHFEPGQRIHTENSYKYTRERAAGLLEQAGFAVQSVWQDGEGWFALIHAAALPQVGAWH